MLDKTETAILDFNAVVQLFHTKELLLTIAAPYDVKIFPIYPFEIIPEIAFGKRHDSGHITYLTQKPDRRQYYCGRQKKKTDKRLS